VFCASFLVYFAAMARDDWRAAREYRESTCTILDHGVDAATSDAGKTRRTPTYAARFAVRYAADGASVVSSGYGTPSRLRSGSAGSVADAISRFAVGSTHPCWYDPVEPRTVLLDTSPGALYPFAALPLLAAAYALVMLKAALSGRA
jgi:hypothetical protein